MCISVYSCADPSGSPACDKCLPRYKGPQCDQCSAGFYKASGVCVPCECNGNADPQGPTELCQPDTGHCLRCNNKTTGPQCQLCAPGFIGDARAHNCTRPSMAKPHLICQTNDSTRCLMWLHFHFPFEEIELAKDYICILHTDSNGCFSNTFRQIESEVFFELLRKLLLLLLLLSTEPEWP